MAYAMKSPRPTSISVTAPITRKGQTSSCSGEICLRPKLLDMREPMKCEARRGVGPGGLLKHSSDGLHSVKGSPANQARSFTCSQDFTLQLVDHLAIGLPKLEVNFQVKRQQAGAIPEIRRPRTPS